MRQGTNINRTRHITIEWDHPCIIEQVSENWSKESCASEQESEKPPKDGKVVAVQTDRGDKFRDITLELLEKEIDYFFLGSEGGIPQHLYKCL